MKLPDNTDGSALYDWAKFIAAETEEELCMIAERTPQVKRAVVKLRELSADERALDMYERREKALRDIASRERWVKQEGRQEGRQEGILSVARNLLNADMPAEAIAAATGLTREEVDGLRDAD